MHGDLKSYFELFESSVCTSRNKRTPHRETIKLMECVKVMISVICTSLFCEVILFHVEYCFTLLHELL